MTQHRRRDAEQNRVRILAAAHTAFAADGLDVPVREIARQAGVAPATVYRHFATHAELVQAVLADHVTACAAEIRGALDDPDPGRALRATVERFGRRQIHERGLNEALLGPGSRHGPFATQRRSHAVAFARLVDRARAAGDIRPDVTVDDVRAGLIAITSIGPLPHGRRSDVIRRLVSLILAGVLSSQEDSATTS